MRNSGRQRNRRGLLFVILLLVGISWLIYDDLMPPPLETMLADRMRCAYNYRDAKLVKRQYANGIVYYQCVQQ